MRMRSIITAALLVASTGCKQNPSPPTQEDAITVWNNLNLRSGLGGDLQLIELKKTDGQSAEAHGINVYTLFYDVREKHLTKMGHWKPGDVETIHSNYGFQKTENGWQGPDGTHFDH